MARRAVWAGRSRSKVAGVPGLPHGTAVVLSRLKAAPGWLAGAHACRATQVRESSETKVGNQPAVPRSNTSPV